MSDEAARRVLSCRALALLPTAGRLAPPRFPTPDSYVCARCGIERYHCSPALDQMCADCQLVERDLAKLVTTTVDDAYAAVWDEQQARFAAGERMRERARERRAEELVEVWRARVRSPRRLRERAWTMARARVEPEPVPLWRGWAAIAARHPTAPLPAELVTWQDELVGALDRRGKSP